MARLHDATLTPTKRELLDAWLPTRSWFDGELDRQPVGSFRLDDPEGEVGLEGFLLGSEGRTTLVDAGDFELVVARVVGVSISAEQTLVATWAGGRDVVVAGLRPRRL